MLLSSLPVEHMIVWLQMYFSQNSKLFKEIRLSHAKSAKKKDILSQKSLGRISKDL